LWIDRRILALRRYRVLGYVAAAGLVLVAILLREALPGLPPFLTLFPAILLSAVIGGRGAGIAALCASVAAAWPLFISRGSPWSPDYWGVLSIIGFLIVGGLMISVVDLLDQAVQRVQKERERLSLALRAADAGAWEWTPPDKLIWDRTFYQLLGLDPAAHKPSLDLFVSRVHPTDREKMRNSGNAIMAGEDPSPRDEFKFIRPDGTTGWLENHRAVAFDGMRHIIGITQDITRRKENEHRILELMREVAHRVRNQYAVILAMIRETNRQSRTPAEFQSQIDSRISALARSHDLLVNAEWVGAAIGDIVTAHLEPYCSADRFRISGPRALLTPMSVQYLGMAVHELATNSVKHGALSTREGRLEVTWSVKTNDEGKNRLQFHWQEFGGPHVGQGATRGFGRQVLEHLAPVALGGTGLLEFNREGITWSLEADNAFVN
jgi:two-component sensor histidine kinase/PAS domain-containing protein